MADEVYEAYVRTKSGETMELPFREALKQFLSDNGYRISINIEGVVIVLRRETQVDEEINSMDKQLRERSLDCMVTFRGSSDDPVLRNLPPSILESNQEAVMVGWDNE